MTIKQFKEARAKLGLSQEKLGRLLDVSVYLINRWECGRRPIPKVVELALRYLVSTRRKHRG